MKAQLAVECSQCKARLGVVGVDTADMPENLQDKVNKVILAHRGNCKYYRDANNDKEVLS